MLMALLCARPGWRQQASRLVWNFDQASTRHGGENRKGTTMSLDIMCSTLYHKYSSISPKRCVFQVSVALFSLPLYQGKNVNIEEYDALATVNLPETQEYKDDLPLPILTHVKAPIQGASRPDGDALGQDDWAKLDSMVGAV